VEPASNPYRPPTATVETIADDTTVAFEVAGKGRRFLTWVVDYAGFLVLSMLIGIVIAIGFGRGALSFLDGGWSYVFGFVVMSGYYLFFEGMFGRTPGKVLLGTKVVDLKGGEPTMGAIVKRTLARFVPFEGLSFLGERGFHDRVSSTLVIRRR
jgi:uncharacterized RDD family membrane protein YckC